MNLAVFLGVNAPEALTRRRPRSPNDFQSLICKAQRGLLKLNLANGPPVPVRTIPDHIYYDDRGQDCSLPANPLPHSHHLSHVSLALVGLWGGTMAE